MDDLLELADAMASGPTVDRPSVRGHSTLEQEHACDEDALLELADAAAHPAIASTPVYAAIPAVVTTTGPAAAAAASLGTSRPPADTTGLKRPRALLSSASPEATAAAELRQQPAAPSSAPGAHHYVEVLTGIKIKNPVVSGLLFKAKLQAMQFVPLRDAKLYRPEKASSSSSSSGRWVTIGVLSQKTISDAKGGGSTYSRWKLSTLRGEEVMLMVFGRAHTTHYAMVEGSVVAVYCAKVSAEHSSLSVSEGDQLERLADSMGYAICKGRTKDGRPCRNPVDATVSPFCEFHALAQARNLKQELRRGPSLNNSSSNSNGSAARAALLGGGSSSNSRAAPGAHSSASGAPAAAAGGGDGGGVVWTVGGASWRPGRTVAPPLPAAAGAAAALGGGTAAAATAAAAGGGGGGPVISMFGSNRAPGKHMTSRERTQARLKEALAHRGLLAKPPQQHPQHHLQQQQAAGLQPRQEQEVPGSRAAGSGVLRPPLQALLLNQQQPGGAASQTRDPTQQQQLKQQQGSHQLQQREQQQQQQGSHQHQQLEQQLEGVALPDEDVRQKIQRLLQAQLSGSAACKGSSGTPHIDGGGQAGQQQQQQQQGQGQGQQQAQQAQQGQQQQGQQGQQGQRQGQQGEEGEPDLLGELAAAAASRLQVEDPAGSPSTTAAAAGAEVTAPTPASAPGNQTAAATPAVAGASSQPPQGLHGVPLSSRPSAAAGSRPLAANNSTSSSKKVAAVAAGLGLKNTAAAAAHSSGAKGSRSGSSSSSSTHCKPGSGGPPGSDAARFRAAFGEVAKSVEGLGPNPQLLALAEGEERAALMRGLDALVRKEAVVEQLQAITTLQVSAWRCKDCNRMTERRPLECRGHQIQELRVTKRWFRCDACGWKVTTLGEVIPSKRCPKCRGPSKDFTACSAFNAPKVQQPADPALAPVASRDNMLPRGIEHGFCLNS